MIPNNKVKNIIDNAKQSASLRGLSPELANLIANYFVIRGKESSTDFQFFGADEPNIIHQAGNIYLDLNLIKYLKDGNIVSKDISILNSSHSSDVFELLLTYFFTKQDNPLKITFNSKVESFAGSSSSFLREEVKNCLKSKKYSKQLCRQINSVTEEMIMNANKDALLESPFHRSPNTQVKIIDNKNYVLIQAIDNFGSFTSKKFWNYISKIKDYGSSSLEIDRKTHGAGIGLLKILQNSHALVVRVKPDEKTIVSAIIEKNIKLPSVAKGNRTISFMNI